MSIKESIVTVEPTLEPFDLTEAKSVLELSGTEKDAMIQDLITTAREHAERFTGRSLMTQTRALSLDYFPLGDTIELMNGPVQSITHVKYQDQDDAEKTLSSSDYWTDLTKPNARIVVKNYWPSSKCRPNAVTVTYVCGYVNAVSVPQGIKSAMKLIMAHLFEHREQNSAVQLYEVPFDAQMMLTPYVIVQDAFY